MDVPDVSRVTVSEERVNGAPAAKPDADWLRERVETLTDATARVANSQRIVSNDIVRLELVVITGFLLLASLYVLRGRA